MLAPVAFSTLAFAPRIDVTLYAASKCPDAPRCERFLRPVFQTVGSLINLQLDFIGTPNASAPSYGVDCMHGPSECVGDAVQLCVQKYFPFTIDHDTRKLGPHLSWSNFLGCVGDFNHTADSAIPGNTNVCLQSLGVPSSLAMQIDDCAQGPEGQELLQQSVRRTLKQCGAHSDEPRRGCKSCTMHLDGEPKCVLDDGQLYNCSNMETPQAWVRAVCAAAAAKQRAAGGAAAAPLPLACRVEPPPPDAPGWPRVWGHSYASVDAGASAAFAMKYFGATLVSDNEPHCGGERDGATGATGATGASAAASAASAVPREVVVRLPSFADYRGGGLRVRFVSNPRKPGGAHGVAAHVAALTTLYGNLSDNSGHHWNQFFDNHLGFYVGRSDVLAAQLLRDAVPFFTGNSDGVFQSVYVVIPGTGRVVEVLGDWVPSPPGALPSSHVRFSSTDQFCSPKRRRALLGGGDGGGDGRGGRGGRGDGRGDGRAGGGGGGDARAALGVDYSAGDADTNKTTMAGADPDAAVAFAARYLGATPVQQHRGPMADGPCVKLAWAQWPDAHQWHVVDYKSADWVTIDSLRPTVPYNISQLAAYVEGLRRLGGGAEDAVEPSGGDDDGAYDQYLDYHDIFEVGNLTALWQLVVADGVPHLVRGRAARACSLYLNVPKNGIAVELRAADGDAVGSDELRKLCAARPFDLCAAK